jgi:DNA-binding transcriptional MerR regulator
MSDQVLFSIGEVASIVGLSRHTIRAWERRHGLLEPQRTLSGQRRYTAGDVGLLLQVKHSSAQQGVSLKVATRSARGELSVPSLDVRHPAPAGVIGREPASERPADRAIWRSAANLMPQLIVILDVDGSITAGNRAASHVLGVGPEEMVGRRFTNLLGRIAEHADIDPLLQRAYVLPSSFELELRGSVGPDRWAFDCRPFSYEGQPRLAIFGRAAGCAPRHQQSE